MLPSLRSISAGSAAVIMTILPSLAISIRAICTPAAVTALTALVTSCCRNVEGEIAPELTGHGLPLSKCEAYNRVYDQF